MRSATASIDIASCTNSIWQVLTSGQHSAEYLAGLRLVSRWHQDAQLDAFYACARVATGTVVVADAPQLLVYRLEDPATGEVDCWVSWTLAESDPGISRVTLTIDSSPYDPPVDSVRVLSNLKTYLETSARLAPGAADGRPGAAEI
jgi:uncharacterized protein YndB with AHSA1/START domain